MISECVLIYLDPLDSNRIIDWLTRELTDAMVALYEQIKPDDAFGRMMIHNLQVTNTRASFICIIVTKLSLSHSIESSHWIAWHPCLSRIEGPGTAFLTIGMGSCQSVGHQYGAWHIVGSKRFFKDGKTRNVGWDGGMAALVRTLLRCLGIQIMQCKRCFFFNYFG